MATNVDSQINELRQVLASYQPGSTIRFNRQRPKSPPKLLRIGLFGPTGVGKSAFINSVNYATGERWTHMAPEGLPEEASKTMKRNAHDIAENITIVDNRGMRSLGGPFMAELEYQVGGVYGDDTEVQWERDFIGKVVAAMKNLVKRKVECRIHCAVLVISAQNLSMRPTDLTELITTIQEATGEPPVIVITHRNSPGVRSDVLRSFRAGLQEQRIDYVFEVENYTFKDHGYDPFKHLVLLEAIHQCAMVGDRVMKHGENTGTCAIL